MAQKQFKIGLSNQDKQNMAQDVYKRVLALTFNEYDTATEYEVGDFVVYNDQLYKCIGATSGAWDSSKWQLATLNDLVYDVEGAVVSVNGKANIEDLLNGTLVVAKATSAKSIEPISTESGAVQETPFVYQGTGTANGSAAVDTSPVGKHLEKQGNSAVVNQQVRNGDFSLNAYWSISGGSLSISGGKARASANNGATLVEVYQDGLNFIKDHKYLRMVTLKSSVQLDSIQLGGIGERTTLDANTIGGTYFIIKTALANQQYFDLYLYKTSFASDDYIDISNCYDIDLTQWFNGDIPQDILDKPSNFFRYYNGSLAYNEGTLETSNGRYLVCGGRNVWDEESIYNYGLESKNFIRVIPGATYYLKCQEGTAYFNKVLEYDAAQNQIVENFAVSQGTFTVSPNTAYIKFRMNAGYGNVYNHDITISLYYETGDGYDKYYPYEEPKVYDTGTEVLRKAGNVADIKLPSGEIKRNVGVVDLSTLSWTEDSENSIFYTAANILTNAKLPSAWNAVVSNILSSKYLASKGNPAVGYISLENDGRLRVGATASPSGYLFYELAEPTTEQGTPFSENIEINDYGTMGWLDTNDAYVEVPQGCKIFYPADYSLFIDSLGQREDINWNPLAIVSQTELAAYLTTLTGYDATKTQTLKNVNGTFTWVDDE